VDDWQDLCFFWQTMKMGQDLFEQVIPKTTTLL
jgi:hypothetical protein